MASDQNDYFVLRHLESQYAQPQRSFVDGSPATKLQASPTSTGQSDQLLQQMIMQQTQLCNQQREILKFLQSDAIRSQSGFSNTVSSSVVLQVPASQAPTLRSNCHYCHKYTYTVIELLIAVNVLPEKPSRISCVSQHLPIPCYHQTTTRFCSTAKEYKCCQPTPTTILRSQSCVCPSQRLFSGFSAFFFRSCLYNYC